MSLVSPYKVTEEDLVDLDSKTRAGIAPLLDALNETIGQLVSAQQFASAPRIYSSVFVTEDTGAAYVDINPGLPQPTVVVINPLRRTDGTAMNAAYSASGTPITSGYRLLFVGLEPLAQYAFTVSFQ